MDKGGQMWTNVDKGGQRWTKVDKGELVETALKSSGMGIHSGVVSCGCEVRLMC